MFHKNLGQWPGYKLGSIRSKRLHQFFDLKQYPIFVETGTCTGDGVGWALEEGFRSIHSIEADSRLYEMCVNKFISRPQVNLYKGLSAHLLGEILRTLQGPLFIYLDAHWSDDETSDADPIPLIKETEIYLKYKDIRECLIVIDDERLMVDPVNPPASWGMDLKVDLLRRWHQAGFTSTYLDDSIIFDVT